MGRFWTYPRSEPFVGRSLHMRKARGSVSGLPFETPEAVRGGCGEKFDVLRHPSLVRGPVRFGRSCWRKKCAKRDRRESMGRGGAARVGDGLYDLRKCVGRKRVGEVRRIGGVERDGSVDLGYTQDRMQSAPLTWTCVIPAQAKPTIHNPPTRAAFDENAPAMLENGHDGY